MDPRFEVTVGAGTMMSGSEAAVRFPHRWTPDGVTVEGEFDTPTWQSAGITYSVEIDSGAPADQIAQLLEVVDRVAEIPQALRAGADVRRSS
jgi:hypothetical protein